MLRPSWLFIAISVVFIGGCLFLGGLVLSGFAHWDPCAWVVAVLFGGPSFVLSYWQYAATFRASQSSANILRYSLPLMGLLGVLLTVVALLESFADGTISTSHIRFLLPPLLISAFLGLIGFLNFRWHRQIRAWAESGRDGIDDSRSRRRLRVSIAQLLAMIAALSAVLAGVTLGYRGIPPQVAMHVTPLEARLRLPAGATDVCIERGPRGIISYNFAIDEAGFWEWTKSGSAGGSLESEASGVTILPVVGSFEIYDSFAPHGVHTVTRGRYYDFHVEDRAHQFVYDADEGRVYYSFHAH